MEPICLVTDTHLGIYKSADVWHDVVLRLFQHIADECTRRNITKIIHLGDFFDNRRVLNVKTLNYAHMIAKILNDFETYIIRGNHDQYFKNVSHPHSLVVFEQYKNIHVVDHPIVVDSIGLVPWMEDFSDLNCDILMGHFEINGFKMNDGYIMRRAHLNVGDFKKHKLVISGHFHMSNSDPNNHIYYLGSPYQQDFGDAGHDRGYYFFSPVDNGGDFEFIKFTDAPEFLMLDTENIDFDNVEGNIVKLVFQKDYGTIRNTEIVDEVQMMKPLYLYTDFTEAAVELTEEIIDDKVEMRTEKEIVKSYVDKSECPDGLEKPTILSMFNNLIDQVLEDLK